MRSTFIDPGQLRTELLLEGSTPSPDGMGGHTDVWSEVASVWAMVEPIGAAARFDADQTLETATHRITIRHRAGVLSGMRFRKDARFFDIMTVHDPDETARYLVCRVREKAL